MTGRTSSLLETCTTYPQITKSSHARRKPMENQLIQVHLEKAITHRWWCAFVLVRRKNELQRKKNLLYKIGQEEFCSVPRDGTDME